MALICTKAPPTQLLSTLDRIRTELGVADTSNDDLLFEMLTRASDAITRECYGPDVPSFGLGTYTETLDGTGSQLLGLTCVPVLRVSAVYQDTELLSPIDPTNPNDPYLDDGYYIESAAAGALYRPCGWSRNGLSRAWGYPAFSSQYILPNAASSRRYTITYVAGYRMPQLADYLPYDPTQGNNPVTQADAPPLPGAVEQACLVTCKAWWYARQRDVTVSRERTLDQDVTYVLTQQGALPATALGLLRDYRRVG